MGASVFFARPLAFGVRWPDTAFDWFGFWVRNPRLQTEKPKRCQATALQLSSPRGPPEFCEGENRKGQHQTSGCGLNKRSSYTDMHRELPSGWKAAPTTCYIPCDATSRCPQ